MRSYRILEGDEARDPALADVFIPRHEDITEWYYASGSGNWLGLLRYFMGDSPIVWVGLNDHELPMVIAGINGEFLDPSGVPWMMCSADMLHYARPFLRHTRRLLAGALETYPTLCNYVHAENHSAVAWLRWLKFHVEDEPVPYGPFSQPFQRFSLEA